MQAYCVRKTCRQKVDIVNPEKVVYEGGKRAAAVGTCSNCGLKVQTFIKPDAEIE